MNKNLEKIVSSKNFIPNFAIISSILIVLIVISSIIYAFSLNKELNTLSSRVGNLENSLASTTIELQENIAKTSNTLSDSLNKNVDNIKQNLSEYREEVGDVSSTVSTLQKLSKTDPELLAKYSKVFFLNENYAPARLTEIPSEYKYSDLKVLKLNTQVWPYLKRMLNDIDDDGFTTYVFSAYRSFNEQQALKGQYSVVYGAGSANAFSADQGYSEHQLGTTIDLIAPGLGGVLDGFEATKSYTWLLSNAYKYGFVLSYPKDNKFYVFEPWHWRFVGVKLATYLHKKGINFYDMDQRDIDEYLVNLFD